MKKLFFYPVLLLVILLIIPKISSVLAASFQFDPTSISTPSAQTFTVKVKVNAGSDQIKSADAFVLYDQNLLQAQSVADGGQFPVFNKDLSTAGKVYLSGMESDPTISTGSGTLGTITFQTLANGSGTLTIDCQAGGTSTSVIVKSDVSDTNIIDCTANGTASVTIGTASTGYMTTPEPTLPSVLPKTGIFENVIKYAAPGLILLFIGGAARLML